MKQAEQLKQKLIEQYGVLFSEGVVNANDPTQEADIIDYELATQCAIIDCENTIEVLKELVAYGTMMENSEGTSVHLALKSELKHYQKTLELLKQ